MVRASEQDPNALGIMSRSELVERVGGDGKSGSSGAGHRHPAVLMVEILVLGTAPQPGNLAELSLGEVVR